MHSKPDTFLWCLCILTASFSGSELLALEADEVDFTRDVRPILSDNCFRCHGPDEGTREAELRLDQREGLFRSAGGRQAIKPGAPDESLVIQRVLSHDPDEMMPPADSNKSLTDQEKQILVQWVKQGASWQQHWSFVRPVRPEVPSLDDDEWCRNEIDRFVMAKQQTAGLTPSQEAAPHTLVRRLFLDLIGLPPTPSEADMWIAKIWSDDSTADASRQTSETAYQELVDQLLASPHYGERWARRWLDLARYADTNGYEKDRDRSIWPYRDWVVNAINSGMTFDRFTIEQLAGDMLPEATTQQNIATGFHRNTMLNEEGGIDPLEFRYHAMTDRVATTGTTWLGLTLGCCQCHTHKYDPVSHREYFQVMGLLNNADEPSLTIPDEAIDRTWAEHRENAGRHLAELPSMWPIESQLTGEALEMLRTKEMGAAFDKWRSDERPHAVAWTTLAPQKATANLPLLTIEDDHSIFASGDTAKRDDYVIELAATDRPLTALRLEALPDERLPAGGPGSTYYEGTLGDFYLTEISVESAAVDFSISSATATFAKNRYGNNPAGAELTIDGDIQTGWAVHGRQAERHVAVFVLAEPIPAGQSFTVRMSFGRHFASSLGRFRFSATDARSEPNARSYSAEIASLLSDPQRALSAGNRDELLKTFLLSAPELAAEAEKIRNLQKRPSATSTLVFSERPKNHPRPTYRHHRGEYLQPREKVVAGLPAILNATATGGPATRLEFARWLVSSENPLTARVVVNRHWAAIFGTGIVKTVDDFGLQGQSPSHPELLDWLAVTFAINDGWSLRDLHRRIVSSATYRQASSVNPEASTVDAGNRLLSYSPRYRLDAEVIRDQLLVAAGVFSDKRGGPPVRPPQPAGVTEVAYGKPKWNASSGDDRYRRSLYTFAKRTAPFAMFSTFDAPSGEACIAQRNRSNSPLQALTLLNDVMLIDLSRKVGEQLATANRDGATVQDLLTELFRRVLVRPPTHEELALLKVFHRTQREQFLANSDAALEFLHDIRNDDSNAESSDTEADTAAWAAVSRAVFGIDEALNRE